MTATTVNKEEIRLVVAELGYNKAGLKLGIKPGTLRQWSARFGWNITRRHAQDTVTTVTKPVQVLLDELADNERETRLSLSRYAKRAAQDSEKATIRDAPLVHKVAQTAGIVHKWNEKEQSSNAVVNIALLGVDPAAVQVSEGKDSGG